MNFLEQLAQRLRDAHASASGVEVALTDVQDADIPVLLGLGFRLDRADQTFRLEPTTVSDVIAKLESEETAAHETPSSEETETTSPVVATPEASASESPTEPETVSTESPAPVALSEDVHARILALESALAVATAETQRAIRQRREDSMRRALDQATERGIPAGVINLSRTMLTSLLDVAETPTLLQLNQHGATQPCDVFDSLVVLLNALPTVVPTTGAADGGQVSAEEAEDRQTEEAAKQLMAQ